jgi:hypothetical protein
MEFLVKPNSKTQASRLLPRTGENRVKLDYRIKGLGIREPYCYVIQQVTPPPRALPLLNPLV